MYLSVLFVSVPHPPSKDPLLSIYLALRNLIQLCQYIIINKYLNNFPYFHRLLELNDEWEYAVRYAKNQDPNLGKKAKIVGTGGKGVGKSTMLKYIANRLLQDGPVLWIDLDPGQAEFTLPGRVYI